MSLDGWKFNSANQKIEYYVVLAREERVEPAIRIYEYYETFWLFSRGKIYSL